MRSWERFPSIIGGNSVIVALGGAYLALAVGWALMLGVSQMSIPSVLVVSSFMGAPGIVLLVGGYRLPRTDLHPEYYSTIARWCFAGIGAMLTILAVYHVLPDTNIYDPVQSVLLLTASSCLAGFGVGTYDARAKTHAHQLERQNRLLERTQTQLEDSNERLEQFAYAASHDLQEPLRMVTSYLQLIERRYDDVLDEDGEEFIEYAIDGAERMTEMIEGLLEYSRVNTQGDPFEPVDLDEVFADVRKDLEIRIAETDATIEIDDLPHVTGDASQLRQVFQNLLSNAIEYSGDEPPRVHVTAERREAPRASERSSAERSSANRSSGQSPREDGTAADGSEWIVSVRDEGIGIDPADRDRIFEVFQRLHTHEEYSGTGIGLALCKRIVERHGGEIRVDSEPGEGTIFSVTLPAATDRRDDRSARSDSASA